MKIVKRLSVAIIGIAITVIVAVDVIVTSILWIFNGKDSETWKQEIKG